MTPKESTALDADESASTSSTPAPSDNRRADDGEWITCAVIFAILGGCLALWFGELSLVTTTLAALLSGIGGVLFSEF